MRRSLAVKWIATLLLTSLVGVALVGLFAYRTTISEFDRLRTEQSKDAFLEDVTTYYQNNQTWDGLTTWMRENAISERTANTSPNVMPGTAPDMLPDEIPGVVPNEMPSPAPDMTPDAMLSTVPNLVPNEITDVSPPIESFRRTSPLLFALADSSGTIVFGYGPFEIGQHVPPQMIDDGTPIVIDGERVGTALLAAPAPEPDPREKAYLARTNQALLIGAIGAGATALLLGILLSRHFLRPLTELTTAISAMRQGNLNQQVRVHSQDELGELARTFNQMTAEIHRVNQLREQMTADIAHDLRTPLTVIAGYLEALCDGTFKPTPERFRTMSDEVALLQRLVEDLRTLSLADAGELKLLHQSIQPGELLEQVRQFFEPIAAEQQISLYVEVNEVLPVVQVDRERMVQVLSNLVSNALHYTSANGTVTLLARQQNHDVQMLVKDNGTGIPEDKLPYIFERFYRTDESRHEQAGASGLGLAIAKSIVEAHHGTITAESILGQGTTMIITLPQSNT